MANNILLVKQIRKYFTEKTTISEVIMAGFKCFFLEDKDRGLNQSMSSDEVSKIKVPKLTCIPYGEYEIQITLSNRFKYWLPVLVLVTGFSGIRQHIGNKDVDTDGCQLPGTTRSLNAVQGSTDAMEKILYVYFNHLTLDSAVATQLVELWKKKAAGAIEFGKLFNSRRVTGQKIIIEISK